MLRQCEIGWRVAVSVLALLVGCSQPPEPPPPALHPVPPPEIALPKPIALPPGKRPSELKPGEFIWRPEAAPAGPMVIVVSLDEQRAYVYRNGVAIGVTTVSTGRKGYSTPTGVFTILERKRVHKSDLYDDAPMPFMTRLTWDGVALHAGKLPGYPASHGCVRMPYAFAKLLFGETFRGLTVVIASAATAPLEVAHPGLRAPLDDKGRPVPIAEPPAVGQIWRPERSLDGPLTVLVSTADRAVHVFRNGVEIGSAPVTLRDPSLHLGSVVLTRLEGFADRPSTYVPGRPAMRWMAVGLPENLQLAARMQIIEQVSVPSEFASKIYDVLAPGSTIVITDLPATPATRSAPGLHVLEADDPKPAKR